MLDYSLFIVVEEFGDATMLTSKGKKVARQRPSWKSRMVLPKSIAVVYDKFHTVSFSSHMK